MVYNFIVKIRKNRPTVSQYSQLESDRLKFKLKSYYNGQLYYLLYLKDDEKSIGYCDLRIGHTQNLYYYGNIGYRIHEDYRGHHYAYEAAAMLLKIAKALNMGYCIITCSPDNVASRKTIEKLECEYVETVNVPVWHPLYFSERTKMIYRKDF